MDDLQLVKGDGFEILKQLSRHGYAPTAQPAPEGEGVLVRHRSAPDLVVLPDGTIRLPATQPTRAAVPATYRTRRISWRRGLLFLFFLAAYTALSGVIVINLIAD